MSKHHTQYTYNQPIYSNPKSNQNIDYGAYQASNYHQKKQTKPQQKIVYQEQVIEQPQTEYIIEGNTYPQTQYIQGNEYIMQDQGVTYENQQTGEITGYEQQIYQPGEQVIYQEQIQPGQQVIYQDQQGQQFVYQDQQGQQIVYQEQQPGQQIIYQEQQPGQQVIYLDQQGQEIIYQDQQQPVEQVIYQDQYTQQIYEQNPQTIQEQRKAKFTKQMASQKPNIKQKQPYQQQEFISRNPHTKQQYQNLNIPQQYNQNISGQKYIPQPQKPIQNQQKQMIQQEKPMIESEFQPDFQVANSVLGISQIPFDPNQNQKKANAPMASKGPYQNQTQQNYIQPSYVVPRRNPNAKITKYDITSSSHYVNTNDPGYRTNKVGNTNQIQNSNKGVNMKSKIPEEQNPPMNYNIDTKFKEKEDQNNISNEEDKPEVGEGIPCLGNSEITNNNSVNNFNISTNNIKTNNSINNKSNINNNINISNNNIQTNNSINNKSNINNNINSSNNNNIINNINTIKTESITQSKDSSNINLSNNNINNNNINDINLSSNANKNNNYDNQMNQEEIEKENPIEEKVPDVSNMDNPNNIIEQEYEKYQPHYGAPEVHESKLKESVDIDDNLDHLPTVGSIMKGKSEMLPPPKKKKYDD